jgi:alpha-methylacyl-CoA racemase
VYACKDGRVAVAALEPHFATALLTSTSLATAQAAKETDWFSQATAQRLKRYFAGQSCEQLRALATAHDLPLLCLQT